MEAIMLVSIEYLISLYIFCHGYFKLFIEPGKKERKGKIFTLFPLMPGLLLILAVVSVILTFISVALRKRGRVEVKKFMSRSNYGILISCEKRAGVLSSSKDEIGKMLNRAFELNVLKREGTPTDIFFILNGNDVDILKDRNILESIGKRRIWVFIDEKHLRKLSDVAGVKILVFDTAHVDSWCDHRIVIGLITRFLTSITEKSSTQIDHVYNALPICSVPSMVFPLDSHKSISSALVHQKFLSVNHGEEKYAIFNSNSNPHDFLSTGHCKNVKATGETFLIGFAEYRRVT